MIAFEQHNCNVTKNTITTGVGVVDWTPEMISSSRLESVVLALVLVLTSGLTVMSSVSIHKGNPVNT